MIPKIIHYIWLGGAPLPPLAERCIASWREHMPSWQIMRWDENNFDIAAAPLYVRQAYEARKYAFVSDYVRLWALEQYGGLYMDVDFEVFRPFDDLMDRYPAFAGYEGSKRQPVMQGVIDSEPHGAWDKFLRENYPEIRPNYLVRTYRLLPFMLYFAGFKMYAFQQRCARYIKRKLKNK